MITLSFIWIDLFDILWQAQGRIQKCTVHVAAQYLQLKNKARGQEFYLDFPSIFFFFSSALLILRSGSILHPVSGATPREVAHLSSGTFDLFSIAQLNNVQWFHTWTVRWNESNEFTVALTMSSGVQVWGVNVFLGTPQQASKRWGD